MSWKDHIAELTSKLNKACYDIGAIKPLLSLDVLKIIYFSYVHSVMSSDHSDSIFKIQKRIIRIITDTGRLDSCHQLYKQLWILPLPSQYIFSLPVFVNKYKGQFLSNLENHDINAHYNYNLHLPSRNLTLVQKGVLYSGSRFYNHLPLNIKILSNDVKHFKSTLRSYLIEHTFYSVDEYYQLTS